MQLGISLMEDVNRCLLCYDAPCNKACPGNKSVSEIIMSLRFQNYNGAVEKSIEALNKSGECGRLCNDKMYCQRNCIRSKIDRPIKIRMIQEKLYAQYLKGGEKNE